MIQTTCLILSLRLGSDLVLWEPASPAVAERTNARSMLLSCMDVIQPAVTKEERFQMCKSVLKEGWYGTGSVLTRIMQL